jgi:fatty-acyl-CoA synthase
MLGTAVVFECPVKVSSFRPVVWCAKRAAELARLPVVLGRVLPAARFAEARGGAPFVAWLEQQAARYPDRTCWELDEERLSFAQALAYVRRAARVLVDAGVQPGDVVALVAGNSPRYLGLLVAVSYAGAAAALVNPELRGEPLAHAVSAVEPRLSLVEAPNQDALSAVPSAGPLLVFGPGALDEQIASARELETSRADARSVFVYIYTSGTTGLPKPCRVRHERARAAATIFGSVAFEFRAGKDKLYCALPLHHSSALLIGVGAALVAGVPVALRRKFSAREFASDLVRYGATATLYVGDVCRALVHSPVTPAEGAVRLRVAVGNGLEAHVWLAFQRRFGHPQIREFYASTEAPAAILNLTGTVGSLGHVPFERHRGFRLARLDSERLELARDLRGRVTDCAADEPGELLFRVFPNPDAPHGSFGGYTDDAASVARIARDVFEPGDAYFRSGDLLRRDRHGFFYFVDRLGDGFRWKGENVSALEVERVLDAELGFPGVAVFGVAVPGYPGRAGFAEVVTPGEQEAEFDMEGFARAARALPAHARPCFVRQVAALELTSSFKIKKHALDQTTAALHEAFAVGAPNETRFGVGAPNETRFGVGAPNETRFGVGAPNEARLWVRQNDRYVVLTSQLWDDLCRGQARL